MRLGDLDPRYLRHVESKAMISFAQHLFDETDSVLEAEQSPFERLWATAARLSLDC